VRQHRRLRQRALQSLRLYAAGNRAQNGTNGRATADVLAGSFIRTEPARTRAFLSILFCKKVFVAAYGN